MSTDASKPTRRRKSTRKKADKAPQKTPQATSKEPTPSTLPCLNPATGEVLQELPIPTTEELQQAVQNARKAFVDWRAYSFERRAEIIERALDILLDRRAEIIQAMVLETGKSRTDASAEIILLSETVHYYTRNGASLLADQTVQTRVFKNKRVVQQFSPRGLVVNISPWNYPLDLAWSPMIPALLAGNVVINKPSEVTPLISIKFCEILHEAGLPKHAAQVLVGYGDIGAFLCKEADYVAFTGSVATGKKVAATCAENLTPYTLELGGKDAAIVLEDADLERAANGIVYGAFFNSGQTCISIERVYAVEEIYDELVDRVVRLTRTLRQGIDTGYNVDLGSMIHPPQLDIVHSHVEDALAKGATLRIGGRKNPDFPHGFFYEPTVLVDVDHSMDVMTEETFGPVLPIMKVRDAEEALQKTNASIYGLAGSVWTRDKERGRAIARRMESGNVSINDCFYHYVIPEASFGGVKDSGVGRRKGPGELYKYCHEKTVLENLINLKKDPAWYPYSPGISESLLTAFTSLHRSGVSEKLRILLGQK